MYLDVCVLVPFPPDICLIQTTIMYSIFLILQSCRGLHVNILISVPMKIQKFPAFKKTYFVVK